MRRSGAEFPDRSGRSTMYQAHPRPDRRLRASPAAPSPPAIGLAKALGAEMLHALRQGAVPVRRDRRDAADAAAGVLRRAGAHRDAPRARRASRPARPPASPARRRRSKACSRGRRSSTTPSEQHCDLIVMGSHGRSGLASLFLGSETQRRAERTRGAGARRPLTAAPRAAGRSSRQRSVPPDRRRASDDHRTSRPAPSQSSCAAVSRSVSRCCSCGIRSATAT